MTEGPRLSAGGETDARISSANLASLPGRAGNRRGWWLSALRAHTKVPYNMDFHRENGKER
jgi:hypothetical protein